MESVELLLELNANITTFSKKTSLFMSDMATELGVLPSQVGTFIPFAVDVSIFKNVQQGQLLGVGRGLIKYILRFSGFGGS